MEDNTITIHIPDGKRISADIDGKTYYFTAILSLKDYQVVLDDLKNEPVVYKDVVAKIVLRHVCNDEANTLGTTMLPDSLLREYIDDVITDSTRLKAVYELKNEITDLYERFILAAKENINNELSEIKERLGDLKLPQINIPKEILDVKSLLPDLSVFKESMAQICKSVVDTQQITKSIVESIKPVIEAQQLFISQIAEQVSKLLPLMTFPTFSEEEVEEMRKALCKWGEYGWTIPENAPISEFLQSPASLSDANLIASKYCNVAYMNEIIDELKHMKGVKKSDFLEAVDNYYDKRYKSCSYILFSLIDSKLIRMQNKKEQGKMINRKVGLKAVNKSKEQILDKDIENTVFLFLRLENVYACLAKYFESGNNFEIQPEILNRNFLDHGMLTRKVTKRDCNKILLLYYNWLTLMEDL